MTKKMVLLGVALLGLFVVLAGCTAGDLAGVGQGAMTAERGSLSNLTPRSNDIHGQGIAGTVSVPGTVSASISYGDIDWYHVYGLSTGDKLAVQLAATCNCDVAIDEYYNNQWQFVAQNIQVYTGPKAIVADVYSPNDTWIWVRAWQSNGDYTLTVGTQQTVYNYFTVNLRQIIPQFEYQKLGTFTLYQVMDITANVVGAVCSVPVLIETGDPEAAENSCDIVSKVSDALAFNPSWFPDGQFNLYCWTVSYYYVNNVPISCFFFPAEWVP